MVSLLTFAQEEIPGESARSAMTQVAASPSTSHAFRSLSRANSLPRLKSDPNIAAEGSCDNRLGSLTNSMLPSVSTTNNASTASLHAPSTDLKIFDDDSFVMVQSHDASQTDELGMFHSQLEFPLLLLLLA